MDKLIIYFDEAQFNQKVLTIQKAAADLQSLMDEIIQLNASCQLQLNTFTIEDLIKVAIGGEEALKERIAQSLPATAFGPFKLKKRATVDILELPDFSTLKTIAQRILTGSMTKTEDGLYTPVAPIDIALAQKYLIVNNQTVELDQQRIEELKESCCLLAKTFEQKALFDAHEKLTKAMSSFSHAYFKVHGHCINKDTPIRELFNISEGEVKLHHSIKAAVTKILNGKEQTVYPAETVARSERISEPSVGLASSFYRLHPFPIERLI